jgi:thiamine kinase-like enzyme
VHPDFVLANAIPTAEDRLVIVDWAGSGRGPRLWSIGFLLWSAGARSPKLVELVASRYRRHIALEDDELERLAGAIRARPLMLECWSFCVGRRALADAVVVADNASELAERIASQARRVFAQRSED